MKKKVLIAGGTGLVGKALQNILLEKGYGVGVLSRSTKKDAGPTQYFLWNPDKKELDNEALEWADIVVNLSGAGVADKKWTKERKKVLRDSRVESTILLHNAFEACNKKPEVYIGASAIGYYGYDTGGVWKKEGSRFGDDYLATLTKEWEASTNLFTPLCRTVLLRIGIVLAKNGGAYEKLVKPAKLGISAPVGNGTKYMSWIHVLDLANMIVHSIENQSVNGAYNAVAPHPRTNKEFTKALAKSVNKPCFLPGIPTILFQLAMGEMASIITGGSRISAEKVLSSGFAFQYPILEDALQQLNEVED